MMKRAKSTDRRLPLVKDADFAASGDWFSNQQKIEQLHDGQAYRHVAIGRVVALLQRIKSDPKLKAQYDRKKAVLDVRRKGMAARLVAFCMPKLSAPMKSRYIDVIEIAQQKKLGPAAICNQLDRLGGVMPFLIAHGKAKRQKGRALGAEAAKVLIAAAKQAVTERSRGTATLKAASQAEGWLAIAAYRDKAGKIRIYRHRRLKPERMASFIDAYIESADG